MRFSENWLRHYVNPDLTSEQLVHQLTMAGLEVDSLTPAAGVFSQVVVGEILTAESHPEADRLRICTVGAGAAGALQIVCGAPNARPGIRVPLALVGAELPGGFKIKPAKLRGVESFGMLCSAKELGIEEDASGLWELPLDAPVGEDIRAYLGLDDHLIEVDLTPNRADCLSVEGIAREVSLLNGDVLDVADQVPVAETTSTVRAIELPDPLECPRYLGQMIEGVDRNAPTPLWMKERLRRSGLRSLDIIVDVTNYVLLELGQPLHAFDAARLNGTIRARLAHSGERLELLNGQTITLDDETLVIADDQAALALAGIMGGKASAVGPETRDIFLECAFFTPDRLMGKARRYGLSTDSSHRFERGVSFELQPRALARAASLILEYAGGAAGPVVEVVSQAHLPQRAVVTLKNERLSRILGLELPFERVERILSGLGMSPLRVDGGWQVVPPAARFDINIEADLIEEIGRVYGYDHLPLRYPMVPAAMRPASEAVLGLDRVKDLLVDRGYQEAITYSFIGLELQQLIDPGLEALALKNPLSAELGVMRTSLWPGLLDAALKNMNRQQDRVRLFESGLRFIPSSNGLLQEKAVAWLASGPVNLEQWGEKTREIDFFDVKGDVEAVIALTGRSNELEFVATDLSSLHPGQSAEIRLAGERIGVMGLLHPQVEKTLGFDRRVFIVSMDQDALLVRKLPRFRVLSRFPSVRRDMALNVAETTSVGTILRTARQHAGQFLQDVVLFDVYRGPGLDLGRKSVAIGLIWQNAEETLVDEQIDGWFAEVVDALSRQCDARLRD
jgi:phenylalanyl-tRNA synthetase beta chain